MVDIDLGDDYDIEEDSNNNLVITHTPSGSELRFDSVDELFEFASQARFTDALVDSNGKTIYDVATGTVGDGTTNANHESVSTDKQLINHKLPQYSAVGNDLEATADALEMAFQSSSWRDVNLKDGPEHELDADAFNGGIVAKNGDVILAPFGSSYVGVYDPVNNEFTRGPENTDASFWGGALLPDGRIVFAPHGSPNVGIYEPETNSYTSGPAHNEGNNAFAGAALTPDGRVVFAPRESSNVGIFDPSDDSYTSGPAHGESSPTGRYFAGATLAPTGDIIFCPYESSHVGIFDPSDDSYISGDTFGVDPDSGWFEMCCVSPLTGDIIFAPHKSDTVGVYDPEADTYTDGDTHSQTGNNNAFWGAAPTPTGEILFGADQSTVIGVYDPVTDTYRDGPSHGVGENFAYNGLSLVPTGDVVLHPRRSAQVDVIETHSTSPTGGVAQHPLIQTN